MRRPKRRLRVLGTAAVLFVASLVTAGPAARAEAASPAPAWQDCGDGFQCARATVPADYADPSAGTFQLAVIRLPARDQSRRLGSMFVNAGILGGVS